MRDYVIKQLRERTCVRGKQKTWISELSDDQLYELFQRLRNRESAKSIARYIQQAWGVLPESSVHSLSQGVLKFKKRIAHLLLTPQPEGSLITTFPLEKIDQLEGLEGIEHISQLQSGRIQRMMAEEQETGIRHSSLSREIQALSTLTKALTKLKEWDMVHEGLDPVRHRKFEREKQRLQRNWTAYMDELGEDGRKNLIERLNKFLEACKKRAIRVERGPDGKLRPVDPEKSPEPKKNDSEA